MRFLFGIAFAMALAVAAPARAECTCRANGQNYQEGQVACLRLPTGSFAARCAKVLNNTSWEKTGEACPLAETDDDDGRQTPRPQAPQSG